MKRSVHQAVIAVRKTYEDAYAGNHVDGVSKVIAEIQATQAALAALPLLDSRQGVHEFVACVAWMQQYTRISGSKVKELVYTAQMALAAIGGKDNASK